MLVPSAATGVGLTYTGMVLGMLGCLLFRISLTSSPAAQTDEQLADGATYIHCLMVFEVNKTTKLAWQLENILKCSKAKGPASLRSRLLLRRMVGLIHSYIHSLIHLL